MYFGPPIGAKIIKFQKKSEEIHPIDAQATPEAPKVHFQVNFGGVLMFQIGPKTTKFRNKTKDIFERVSACKFIVIFLVWDYQNSLKILTFSAWFENANFAKIIVFP